MIAYAPADFGQSLNALALDTCVPLATWLRACWLGRDTG
jgi:hypothetical protein